MNINMYVVNAVLILMVVRQVREHPLDARSPAVPVLAVGVAAVLFLHSVPLGGHDIALELACVLAGALMGAIGGLATRLRLGAGGQPRPGPGRPVRLPAWPGHPRSVTRSERWWSGPRGGRELVGLSCHSPRAW